MLKIFFKPKPFLFLYIALFIIDQAILITQNNGYERITIIFYDVSLFIFFAYNGRQLSKKFYFLVLLGLCFSIISNLLIALGHQNDEYLIWVLLSYTLFPLCFGLALIKSNNNHIGIGFWFIFLGFLCYGCFLYFKIETNLAESRFPMILNISTTLFFITTILLRRRDSSNLNFSSIIMGITTLIIGNTLYVFNIFLVKFPLIYFLNSIFYATGMYLMVLGILNYKRIE